HRVALDGWSRDDAPRVRVDLRRAAPPSPDLMSPSRGRAPCPGECWTRERHDSEESSRVRPRPKGADWPSVITARDDFGGTWREYGAELLNCRRFVGAAAASPPASPATSH